MNRRTHLRNAAVAGLVILLLFLLATQHLPAVAAPPQSPMAQAQVGVNPLTATASLAPNSSTTVTFTIANNTAEPRTFNASFSGTPTGFTVTQQSSISISANSSGQFNVLIASTASGQAPGAYGPVTVTFTGAATGQSNVTGSATINITVTGATFTPTITPTATTGVPTATPTRGPVCRDGFEGDNEYGDAKVLDVNTSQERAICPAGDVDWLVFGGVHGKTYTVDISRMDPGIDLSLELFDSDLNSIAFNDDFYNRDPANPNPGDTRPRIQIRIPADGRYYIKVRDSAGRGGVNYIYVIALLDESYGPTPTLVREICIDLFEPDGLPEQSHLLTSNEIQEDRKLCPAGDADWVTFFGKAGKRYILYTDTRRYRGRNTVNGETQAGADTTIVLSDRDGVTLLDVNDDIPGGSTLDSQIEFTPDIDGFYFLQVKNTGDIGNQFIRYDLVLLLCVPGQTDCGRATVAGTPVIPITPLPTGTPGRDFNLDLTSTPRPTVTNTP
ncbi:MAG: peptidase [Chloroflexales bacterium]|nr:peptidase [Chloroflexales bacterium]